MKTCCDNKTNWRVFMRWHAILLLGAGTLLLLMTSCFGLSSLFYTSLQEQAPPPWHGSHVTVDLSRKLHPYWHEIEFATQNEPYIGFWSLPRNAREGSYDLTWSHQIQTDAPGHYVILDFQGNLITDAVTATGALSDQYAKLFPTLAARRRHADFIRGAEFWAFSPDGVYGIKSDTCYTLNDIFDEQKGMKVHPCTYEAGVVNVELWDLTRNECLWQTHVYDHPILLAHVVSWQGQSSVLIVFPRQAYILSQTTGKILATFPYTIPQESTFRYRQRFQECYGNYCRDKIFSSYYHEYSAATRWLICAGFETRRVRIFSIDPPYQFIREFYGERPNIELCEVCDIQMNGNGRYLVLGSRCQETDNDPTEVYDVTTWTRVWSAHRHDITHVRISPDGTTLAFLRRRPPDYVDGLLLEIGEFYPTGTD